MTPEKVASLRERYGDEGVEIRKKLYRNLGSAPVGIVCFTDINNGKPDKVSAALACENLVLAANAEGYGGLMMGSSLAIKDEISYLCGVNLDEMDMVMCIVIGIPDESPEPKERRKGRVVYASNPRDIR
jgi:nitroreductase